MSTTHSRMLLAAAALAGVLCIAGCAAGSGASPAPTDAGPLAWDAASIAPPEGRVIGTGTVLDAAGEPQLCLGIVAESAPPQCSGIPLDGWTWDDVDGSETSGDTTLGTYAVYGIYDGERYAVSDPPIMLALYDPIRPEDPSAGIEGTTAEGDLVRVRDELAASLGTEALTVWTERGYVWIQVVWDDGTLQDAVDSTYGDGVVFVTSALREID
ncbi:hypothetical protein ACIP5T_01160 [Microbacterium sp. NPDC088619]|uniref:hypothetical protein n=1 Tax=Microbacterium sp. NPDC088619 TaxID=3364196 RepID=UPI0037FFC35D